MTQAGVDQAAPEPATDLTLLDERLKPIRRVLAGLPRSARGRRFLEANLGRLVRALREVELPDAVATALDELELALVGLDGLDPDAQNEQIGTAWQVVQRVDRVLGLPLPPAPGRRAPVGPPSLVAQRSEGDEHPNSRRFRRRKHVPSPKPEVELAEVDRDSAEADDADRSWTSTGWRAPIDELDLTETEVEVLLAAGVHTVLDLVRWQPAASRLLSPVYGAGRALPAGPAAVGGRIRGRLTRLGPDGSRRAELVVFGADRLVVPWAQPFTTEELERLVPGAKAVIAVDVTTGEGGAMSVSGGRLVEAAHGAAYELALAEDSQLSQALARARALISSSHGTAADVLPEGFAARYGVLPLHEAVDGVTLRGPLDQEGARRLGFNELLAAQVGLLAPRLTLGDDRGISHPMLHRHVGELVMRGLAPEITNPQLRALEDIKRDLSATAPMRRLLMGDANAGAADVALRAVLMVAASRSQVLVACHDAMAAAVRQDQWQEALSAYGLRSLLVQGEPRRADREELRRGDLHVVFGAGAVFEQGLEWRRLGLVVVEEQAVYGALAQAAVLLRAPRPDVLALCRTPLPWQRLHDAYASFELSHVGSGSTELAEVVRWPASRRDEPYDLLREAVAEGRSALVAFPIRRTVADLLDLRESASLMATLTERIAPGRTLALYHGVMTTEQRAAALRDFEERRAAVLVATTYIEMTTPFPRPVVAVIEHADRVDVQRLLGFRALLGPGGVLHCVEGDEPHSPGSQVVMDLAAGHADETITARHQSLFARAEAAPVAPQLRWRWADPAAEPRLLIAAREIAAIALRSERTPQEGPWAPLLREAEALWPSISEAPCPINAPKVVTAGKKKRRRRRKR